MASSLTLRERIRTRILTALDRLRVLRTLDVTALCFADREFKPALVAAQRAIRGLKKDGLINPYLTDRRQTVYGLTKKGAQWLESRDILAAGSVRRVSEMTNPEHLLWSNFTVLACEARGLSAQTESELLRRKPSELLTVREFGGRVNAPTREWQICPDAVADEEDGLTWFELDRSKRGPERVAKLVGLLRAVGRPFGDSHIRRVVVLAKTQRTFQAALNAVQNAGMLVTARPAEENLERPGTVFFHILTPASEHGPHVFAVYGDKQRHGHDGRTQTVTRLRGHVIVQMLPLSLARFRIDPRNRENRVEWFSNGFLPYFRPEEMQVGTWASPDTPLLEG